VESFSGCIVLYNNDKISLSKAIDSFLNANENGILYLIDNSPNDSLKEFNSERTIYIHNPSNPGFGAAHNIAIKLAIMTGYSYHFIINPDIYFNEDVITPMINYLKSDENVGMLMPQVLNTDGSVQYLPKLLPSIFWIFRRKLKKFDPGHTHFINTYELRNIPKAKIYNAPILSGCFTLLNLKAIQEVGSYDDNFFMYFEDFDLSRRMHRKYKTIYYPKIAVYHRYEGGANKNFKLFKVFIASAIIYFNKWGWFFDRERKMMNKKTLDQF
jgi:GT2 family glycosyltransferase